MIITLYLKDKVVDFRLPNEISGSFSFDPDSLENSLIHVEARNNEWYLYGTDDVSVVFNGNVMDSIVIRPFAFYTLRREKETYLIFVTMAVKHSALTYLYSTSIDVKCANSNEAGISYSCPYMGNEYIHVSFKNNRLVLNKSNDAMVYLNKNIIVRNEIALRFGDEIEIFGLRFLFLRGLLIVHDVPGKLRINLEASKLKEYNFPALEKEKDFEVKDLDLYSASDYYSKSPRLRRLIETKKIKFSSPPKSGDNGQLPMILVVGPMITMGISSSTMVVSTFLNIKRGEATMADSWPTLLMSGAMLISMLVWPLITQAYNKHMEKKKKKELADKYGNYLTLKEKELSEESKLQGIILNENLITVDNCLSIIEHKNIHFWDKRIDQSDFLTVRLGIGNELLDAEVEYQEEDFTIDEDELKRQADALVEKYKYIPNVPIGYSFKDNKITAIMGSQSKTINFVNNLLLQLITFYSYEDLKLVLFTSDAHKNDWAYIKYLNHNFNNDRTFRFFSSNTESAKSVAEYLMSEINYRISQIHENKSITYKPHYLVIIDGFDQVKKFDFIKLLTDMDVDLWFSFILLENRLSNLPSMCNNFITLGDTTSQVLKNSYEHQEQVLFQDEIHYNVDMMKYVRILSNIPIEFEDGIKSLPESISFLEMEHVGKVEQLNILNRWNMNDSTTSLRAEVGVDEQGDLMYLDLHEKHHGPHGLIAGMTGSGKSEFIISYILSMAINYSPDDVSFILIDYKGGGLAYAFENRTSGVVLPHLAGTITNLDKAEMDRTLVSIDSEIKRRQRVFNEARDLLGESTIDIYKYQRFYKEGRLKEPVSHLFIISDEFAELKSQQPEFMDNLISVARIGRSLGVHLILATQKPSGVVNDQIWSNSKFKVCLKVQDEADSKEMLKKPDAAALKQAGRFYLQVGYDEYFALGQSAYCGFPYYPSEKIVKQVDKSVNFINDNGFFIKSIEASKGIKIKAQGEQLANVLNLIIDVANQVNKKAKRLWLPNVPPIILESDLEGKYKFVEEPFNVEAIVGEYDAPEKQEQGVVKYNFLKDGNTLIYGIDGSEREMLLNTIIYSTVKDYDASEINYYVVDYGSEILRVYNSLPHVGGMVFAGEDDKLNNLLKLIKSEIRNRKKLFANYSGEYSAYNANNSSKLPLKVVIINNYDSFYENNESIYEELPELIRDSERYGIVFIITGNAINSIPNRISQNFSNVYAFRMKESSDYSSLFGVRTTVVPRNYEGRGLLNNDGVHEFQVARIIKDSENLNGYLMDFVSKLKNSNQSSDALKIPILPDVVRYRDVASGFKGLQCLPVGISKGDLEVVGLDLISNLGTIVSANRIDTTLKFAKSFIALVGALKGTNLIVIDANGSLELDKGKYPNYYTSDFELLVGYLNDYLRKQIEVKSKMDGVVVIYGLYKFLSKIGDISKFEEFIKLLKEYERMGIVIVDAASKIKGYSFDAWFTSVFSVNDGIWIGRGVADQNLYHLANVTREMTKDIKSNMGYVISESVASLVKLIDFVSSDEGES